MTRSFRGGALAGLLLLAGTAAWVTTSETFIIASSQQPPRRTGLIESPPKDAPVPSPDPPPTGDEQWCADLKTLISSLSQEKNNSLGRQAEIRAFERMHALGCSSDDVLAGTWDLKGMPGQRNNFIGTMTLRRLDVIVGADEALTDYGGSRSEICTQRGHERFYGGTFDWQAPAGQAQEKIILCADPRGTSGLLVAAGRFKDPANNGGGVQIMMEEVDAALVFVKPEVSGRPSVQNFNAKKK